MSRLYRMEIKVEEYNDIRADDIMAEVNSIWKMDNLFEYGDVIEMDGEGTLVAGESSEEFAKRIAAAIWKENEGHGLSTSDLRLSELPLGSLTCGVRTCSNPAFYYYGFNGERL